MPRASWSFPTSPRNPAKIKVELLILKKLIPSWVKRDIKWGPRTGTQEEFGKALREMGEKELDFEIQTGELTPENLRWTARARFGTYKFFGFVYIDRGGYAQLTKAGIRLIEGTRPHEVMLKQLLKWQYPDNQHNGNEYPETSFHLFPFPAISRIIRELDGLTKIEIALFIFRILKMDEVKQAITQIKEFRKAYYKIKSRVPRKRFIKNTSQKIKKSYRKKGINLPVGSFSDYADALIRYFRYTQLFSVRGDRIVVVQDAVNQIDKIIDMDFDLYPYRDKLKFYAYYGDPSVPILPYEKTLDLRVEYTSLNKRLSNLQLEYSTLNPSYKILPFVLKLDFRSPENLKIAIDKVRNEILNLKQKIDEIKSQGPEKLTEALDFFGEIINKNVIDPPTYFEWNTWRCFVAIDRAKIKPNFVMDMELQPLNHASGNKADMEVYFDTFILVPEVTLKTGANQWRDESMPVPRHVFEIQEHNSKKSKTFGLFIAPKLHSDTVNQFYACMKHPIISGKIVTVIPVTLDQFIDILEVYKSGNIIFGPNQLRSLLVKLRDANGNVNHGEEWAKKFSKIIKAWKKDLSKDGATKYS